MALGIPATNARASKRINTGRIPFYFIGATNGR
jgi:hypothetical protein